MINTGSVAIHKSAAFAGAAESNEKKTIQIEAVSTFSEPHIASQR